MRLIALKNLPGFCRSGHVFTVPDRQGHILIKTGCAKLAKVKKPNPEPEPACDSSV